jgi:hypothetical protein
MRSVRPVLRAAWAAILFLAVVAIPACDERHTDDRPLPSSRQIGRPGDDPGAFVKPRAIASDGSTLWVVDRSGRVQRLDPFTGFCLQILRLPEQTLGFPTGLTIAPSPTGDGRPALWVPDTHYHRVLVYLIPDAPPRPDPERAPTVEAIDPKPIAQFGRYGSGPGEFTYPTSVAVHTREDGKTIDRVYVTEYGGNDRVQIFDAALKPIGAFGRFGEGRSPGETEFQRPQMVIVQAQPPRLIISDSINHRLGVFQLDGTLERWIDGTAGGAMPLRHPRGLRLLDDGTLLIVEFGRNQVRRINLADGTTLNRWGRGGRGPGELAEPWAVEVIGDEAFVVDAMNHRVLEFAWR